MQKSYKLEGLDCASCADKIEKSVQKIHGVEKARVDFMAEKMTLEVESGHDLEVENEARAVIGKLEPDVKVISLKDVKEEEGRNPNKNRLIRIIIAFVLFLALIIIKPSNNWVALASYLVVYVLIGGDIVKRAVTNIFRGEVFDENFLMTVATLGAFAIGNHPEGVAVMIFYEIGELFQSYAVNRSRKSISSLMDIRADYANLITDGEEKKVDPSEIKIDDIIVIKPGERVPLDGIVIEGNSSLDTSALTGESLPRNIELNDEILAGVINLTGVIRVKVTKEFGESTVSRILELVQNASSKKAQTEKFITKFARYYTPVVVLSAVALAMIPPLVVEGALFSDWVYRALIFLVVSCPCALVVSIPLGLFAGIGGASKNGVLIKGGNYLEALKDVETVVFDKTGTLTKGVFKVVKINTNNIEESELLRIAATGESFSNHPIAQSILKAYGNEVDKSIISNYEEISGNGIKVNIDNKEVLLGNYKLMNSNGIKYNNSEEIGTVVHVVVEGEYKGSIVIADEVKEDSKEAIEMLKKIGVKKCVMLTGDNKKVAEKIAEELGLDEVYAELLPTDKVAMVEKLLKEKSEKGKLAFVGDGINDAPVLARADVGVAMGGIGSDAAIEAADVVLMRDNPSSLVDAIEIGRKTNRILWQNIIFSLGVKIAVLIPAAIGIANMWEGVFADVGVTLIAVLNSMRALRK